MVLLNFNKINQIVSAVAIVFFSGIIVSCNLNPIKENSDAIIINFPDPNFEALIREVLEIPESEITNQDLWTIINLNGIGRNISNISGIEYCSGLRILKLRENYIINIEPLAELVSLNYVDLQNNRISDIKPLVDNPGLGIGDDELYLLNNPLSDISILLYKPMIQARGVKVYSNAIAAYPEVLDIIDPNFETVLREHLNKPTGDILTTELETITNLNAQNRNIITVYGIEFCINLNTLDVGENSISDLIPISKLKQLSILKAGNNRIHDISPLSNLLNLQYLILSSNPIDNLQAFGNFGSLNTLELSNLNQFDFSYIKDIRNLQTLYLTNTPIINLDPIANITSLQNLIMKNCNLYNIDSLATLNNLTKLLLNYNIITDITSITDLHELYELNLRNNNISDILPLVNNWGLSGDNDYVLLYKNPLSDTSINTYIPQLQDRDVHVYY